MWNSWKISTKALHCSPETIRNCALIVEFGRMMYVDFEIVLSMFVLGSKLTLL